MYRGDSGVGVGNIQNTLFDEVDNFTIECSLKPVCDMPNHFFAHVDRPFTDRSVEGDGPLYSFRRCLLTSDNLDQRNHVRRVEWMTNHASLGILAGRLHYAHRQTG